MNLTVSDMKEFEVKFNKKGMPFKERICSRFGWKDIHLTINGHTIVAVKEADIKAFEDTVAQLYLSIVERR